MGSSRAALIDFHMLDNSKNNFRLMTVRFAGMSSPHSLFNGESKDTRCGGMTLWVQWNQER
jgi:hypothetical protein